MSNDSHERKASNSHTWIKPTVVASRKATTREAIRIEYQLDRHLAGNDFMRAPFAKQNERLSRGMRTAHHLLKQLDSGSAQSFKSCRKMQ
jgi:hypothetical protein